MEDNSIIDQLFDKAKNYNTLSEWEFIQTIMRELYSHNFYSIEEVINYNDIFESINNQGMITGFQRQILEENLNFVNSLVLLGNTMTNDFNTFIRLRLLAYCYITEMTYLYNIIANLLWIVLGKVFYENPFDGDIINNNLNKTELSKLLQEINVNEIKKNTINDSRKRIKVLLILCKKAKMNELGNRIEKFYDHHLRNSFYHSSYIFNSNGFIGFDKNRNYRYTTEEYGIKIDLAIAFYIEITNCIEKYKKNYKENIILKARNQYYGIKKDIGQNRFVKAIIITNPAQGIVNTMIEYSRYNSNEKKVKDLNNDIIDKICFLFSEK